MFDLVELKDAVAGERRAAQRVRIDRPCKVHDPRTGKYHEAQARDLSEGGVLVRLDHPMMINPGDEIFIGIAQKRRQVFLRFDEMLRVRVVRALGGPDGGMSIAGCFEERPSATESLRRAA